MSDENKKRIGLMTFSWIDNPGSVFHHYLEYLGKKNGDKLKQIIGRTRLRDCNEKNRRNKTVSFFS